MEGMLTFVGIVVIVFGVLQIILFFKVWGMTNDIKNINETINPSKEKYVKMIHLAILEGNEQKAAELIYRCFINEVHDLFSTQQDVHIYKEQYKVLATSYQKKIKKLDYKLQIDFDKYNEWDKIKKLLI